jgi:hypothetical protein
MAANLASVYVNNDRVTLQGDPRPNVAKIVTTLGKKPENVRVVRLERQSDGDGFPLASTEVIDRSANAQTPIYLKCFEEGDGNSPGATGYGGTGSSVTSTSGKTFQEWNPNEATPRVPQGGDASIGVTRDPGMHKQQPGGRGKNTPSEGSGIKMTGEASRTARPSDAPTETNRSE